MDAEIRQRRATRFIAPYPTGTSPLVLNNGQALLKTGRLGSLSQPTDAWAKNPATVAAASPASTLEFQLSSFNSPAFSIGYFQSRPQRTTPAASSPNLFPAVSWTWRAT
jgi:hypothetical protein